MLTVFSPGTLWHPTLDHTLHAVPWEGVNTQIKEVKDHVRAGREESAALPGALFTHLLKLSNTAPHVKRNSIMLTEKILNF